MHSYRRTYNQENNYVKKLQSRIKDFKQDEVDERLNDSFEWEIHEKIQYDKFMDNYNEMCSIQAEKKEKLMIEKKSMSRKYSKSPSGGILRSPSKETKPILKAQNVPKKTKNQRKGDLKDRISGRSEEELMIDILLSGTAATLLIQTSKKIYIGFIGDSLVALQGSEKNVH